MTANVVRPTIWVTMGGQAVAALGTILQWIAAPEFVKVLPSGLGYIAGALVILWLDRHARWSPLAAIVLTAWIFLGTGEMLARQLSSPNTLLAVGNWVMVVGLAASALAGVIALVVARATGTERPILPLSSRNPYRPLVIAALAALVAVEIGLGATQNFDLSRPGPSLFLALPILVAIVPGRSMVLLAAVMSAVFLEASFSYAGLGARLIAPADGMAFTLDVLQLAGMTAMIVVGALSLGRRDSSQVVSV